MTDYASMTIDNLISYRDQWPAQRTEWNRAELALQKRLAVVDELCRLCGELDAEGFIISRREAPVAAGSIWEDMSDAEVIAGTAYQVLGNLMTPKQFESAAGQAALDWFANYDHEVGVTTDLLPWPDQDLTVHDSSGDVFKDLDVPAPLPASPSSVEG